MKGRTLLLLRRTHLFLSVFFSPLLLLFLLTGLWQTVASDDEQSRQGGWLHTLIANLSRVHTDSHFPHFGAGHGSHTGFRVLVVTMVAAFVISILAGWMLAWQMMRQKWLVAGILLLGVLVPVAVLWFS